MKKAFTLMELMVVLAIMGILMGIVLPVYSSVKIASARTISTQSLKQLAVAGNLYLADHENSFWPYVSSPPEGGVQWWFGYETLASKKTQEGQRIVDYARGPLGPYTVASGGVKTDPAFLQYSPRLKPKYQNGNYGYGYNTVLSETDSGGRTRNALQVTSPSQMVVFATCAQVNTFQSPASVKQPMVEEFYMVNDSQVTMHFRHGRDAMASFVDGSVRALSMDKEMLPGSQDMRMPSANIARLKPGYLRQTGW